MEIIYVKVSSKHLNSDAYYAGYSLDVIKEEAHFSLTDRQLDFEAIAPEDIPVGNRVSSAGLSRDDARAVIRRFEGE